MFELSIRLEHGVRVDDQTSRDVLDRGQTVTRGQLTEANRVFNLVDELPKRRHAGAGINAELDHPSPHYSRSLG
ncbi:hypothetical protein QFW96_27010 [Saccharopolyspora sp. TS4A08]|uniref:Uncharacterized protein n=1 Tax=Saccharopolyspora ipomoeae TaxID=3042027 RepID=A0ABT6PWB2_9PSEU|nr:hypothetical protein [Saccharopolyspora sp. TS4A08]MDI2032298.1 hypothetical protein [Saccharopolyspora sp. TS4A08]